MVRIYQVKPWLTASAINTYLWCPRKFYYKYVERRKEKQKDFFVFGNIIHKVPELFFKKNIFDKSKDYSTLKTNTLKLLTTAWRDKKSEIESLNLNQRTKDQNYIDAQKMTLDWLHYFLKNKHKDLKPIVETKIFNHKHKIWCVVDHIQHPYKHPIITDYKSSQKDKITDSIKLQMAIQSICFADKFKRMDHKLGVHFLRFPVSDSNPYYIEPTQELHDFALEKIKIVREGTTTTDINNYPCTCGGECKEDFENGSGTTTAAKTQTAV